MRPIHELIAKLQSDSRALLAYDCVLSLGSFLVGASAIHDGFVDLKRRLLDTIDGPSQSDACTRAYLSMADTRTALAAIVESMGRLARERFQESTVRRGPISFVDYVREPILQGRPAMALGEPSLMQLVDFASGYHAGGALISDDLGTQQQSRLEGFQRWLQAKYRMAGPWYALIRIHEGPHESGLMAFVEEWDRFEREQPRLSLVPNGEP